MERIDELIINLKQHQETHPNIVNLWTNYIKIKKEKMKSIIEDGEKMLNIIDKIQDLPLETILFLIMYKEQICNDNT